MIHRFPRLWALLFDRSYESKDWTTALEAEAVSWRDEFLARKAWEAKEDQRGE